MQITLVPNDYTQINTSADEYLIQNLGTDSVYIKIADTKPGTDAFDFILEPKCGISSSHFSGTVWGKPGGKYPIQVGVVNGS